MRSSRATSSTSTTRRRSLHLETVLHTEIYALRPDVGAVVHGHPPYATAFGATNAHLELLTHDAVLFADGVSFFDETAELITERRTGPRRCRSARPAPSRHPRQPRRRHRRQGRPLGRPQRDHPGTRDPTTGDRLDAGRAAPHPEGARRADGRRQVPGALPRRVLGGLDPQDAARREPTRACRQHEARAPSQRQFRRANEIEPQELLLDFLRDRLGLTGAKRSCDMQACGVCTVLVDGRPVSSCCFLAADAEGRDVLTIEGLAERPEFERLEDAFTRHAALQCGFCTPGMLLTVTALLETGELTSIRGGQAKSRRQPLPLHGLPRDPRGRLRAGRGDSVSRLEEVQGRRRRGRAIGPSPRRRREAAWQGPVRR